MILAYARLAAVIVSALVIAFAVVKVQGWRDDSRALADVEARAAAQVAQAEQAVQSMKAAQEAAYAASQGYQRELEDLRNRPVPVRTVRVLVPAGAAVPAASAAAGRPDDAAGQTVGLVHADAGQTASRDIGADLYALTLEADRCSAQLRGLQAWVQATR